MRGVTTLIQWDKDVPELCQLHKFLKGS